MYTPARPERRPCREPGLTWRERLGAFGDAGAVTTVDASLAATIRSMAHHGRADTDRYLHAAVGTDSRLDSLQAVDLPATLARLDAWTEVPREQILTSTLHGR